jgi:hypothetical protein
VVTPTLLESRELKILDSDGNPRLFVRMYSRVPVLQVMDTAGKPRMSLGLRFDDTPFIDLSDATGRTRATLEMTDASHGRERRDHLPHQLIDVAGTSAARPRRRRLRVTPDHRLELCR